LWTLPITTEIESSNLDHSAEPEKAAAGGGIRFAGLAVCFSGAIEIADGAGGSDGLGDLLVSSGLALTLFRGRDGDQPLAVLCEQDALPPFLGALSTIPSAKPTVHWRATMLPSTSIMKIGR
jgi:hypothetical protein